MPGCSRVLTSRSAYRRAGVQNHRRCSPWKGVSLPDALSLRLKCSSLLISSYRAAQIAKRYCLLNVGNRRTTIPIPSNDLAGQSPISVNSVRDILLCDAILRRDLFHRLTIAVFANRLNDNLGWTAFDGFAGYHLVARYSNLNGCNGHLVKICQFFYCHPITICGHRLRKEFRGLSFHGRVPLRTSEARCAVIRGSAASANPLLSVSSTIGVFSAA